MTIPSIGNLSVSPISKIGLDTAPSVVGTESSGKASFADFLQDAMTDAVSTDYSAKSAGLNLMLGDDVELHEVTIAAQKAELMLSLTVQMRDKIVEAYQEVMRMQI